MKVVINACYGGFGLSHKGYQRYAELVGKELTWRIDEITKKVYGEDVGPEDVSMGVHYELDGEHFYAGDLRRDDPIIIKVVEELGEEANDSCASLRVVEIPNGVEWTIEEYDGNEHIAEKHQTWR